VPRGPCTFRQRDLIAAVKATAKAGCEVARVEVDKSGKITIVTGRPEQPAAKTPGAWDELEP
jgi:hypothetical protein